MPNLWALTPLKGGIRVHIYVIQPSGCARIDVALEGQGEFAPGPGDGTLSLGHRRFIDIVRARGGGDGAEVKLANGALGAAEFQRGAGNRGAADAARSEQGRALRIEGIQTQIYLTRQGVVKMLPKPLSATAHQILEFLLMVGHMGEAECLGRRARQTGRRRNACATFRSRYKVDLLIAVGMVPMVEAIGHVIVDPGMGTLPIEVDAVSAGKHAVAAIVHEDVHGLDVHFPGTAIAFGQGPCRSAIQAQLGRNKRRCAQS